MSKNQFTVDLGAVKLTPEQHLKINTAIHKAVATELAQVIDTGKIILIPTKGWLKGPILDGIVARDLTEGLFNEIIG